MKYLAILLAITVSGYGQTIKTPGVNGENIVNPAFRNAVLPAQSSHSGKFLTTDGAGAVTWATVTSNPTNGTNGQVLTSNGSGGFGTAVTLGTAATTAATAYATAAQGVKADAAIPDGKYYPPITSLAFMGDSITAANTTTTATLPENFSHQDFTAFFSRKSIPMITNGTTKSFGVSGSTTAGWLSVQVPQVVALSVKPSHVVTMIGTNDIGATGNNLPVATTLSNLSAGTAVLRAAGIEPIFCIFPGSVGLFEKTSHNEELANAIVIWGVANGVFVCDGRHVLNDPAMLGRDISGGLFDNLHPSTGWYERFGKILADKLEPALSALSSPFDFSAPINTNPYGASNLGTVYPPAGEYTTSSMTYSARPDGVTGRWSRLEMVYSTTRTMTLGTGNGAVSYAAVAPWTNKQIFIDTQYSGTSTSLDITVYPTETTVLIRVKLKVSGGASTATEVANAVNAAASAYVTATAGGTGASAALSGHLPTRWGVTGTADTGITEVGLLENDQVRCLVELKVLSGDLASFNLTLQAYTNPVSGSDVFQGNFYSAASISGASNPWPIPRGGSFIFATNWISVGSNGTPEFGPNYHRFKPFLEFGGRDCVLEIGRIFIQRRTAP